MTGVGAGCEERECSGGLRSVVLAQGPPKRITVQRGCEEEVKLGMRKVEGQSGKDIGEITPGPLSPSQPELGASHRQSIL